MFCYGDIMFYGDLVLVVLVDILCYFKYGEGGDIFLDCYEGNKIFFSLVIVFVVSLGFEIIFYFMLEQNLDVLVLVNEVMVGGEILLEKFVMDFWEDMKKVEVV